MLVLTFFNKEFTGCGVKCRKITWYSDGEIWHCVLAAMSFVMGWEPKMAPSSGSTLRWVSGRLLLSGVLPSPVPLALFIQPPKTWISPRFPHCFLHSKST
jgi:hypothetical protein